MSESILVKLDQEHKQMLSEISDKLHGVIKDQSFGSFSMQDTHCQTCQ